MGGIVTLTTDFGTRDPYCGAMRGVLLTHAPGVQILDLSHDVPPQDILAGAWVLRHAAFEFPPDTVHLAVVDPGVGSSRRPLAVRAGGFYWVAPDNGLLSFALSCEKPRVHEITPARLWSGQQKSDRMSATFHGRDLFAPAAAQLAAGRPLEQLGPAVADPVLLPAIRPACTAAGLQGSILHVDRFGNLVSCITAADLATLGDPSRVQLDAGAAHVAGIVQTYADVEAGQPAALIGSGGLLELAIRNASAAEEFGLRRGDHLHVSTT